MDLRIFIIPFPIPVICIKCVLCAVVCVNCLNVHSVLYLFQGHYRKLLTSATILVWVCSIEIALSPYIDHIIIVYNSTAIIVTAY